MRSLIIAILCFLVCKTNAASRDTISLYFALGKSQLTPVSEKTLDSFLYYDIINNAQAISILGYGDFVGSEEINMEISKNRANNVQTYLERYGIKKENINLILGKGKVNRILAAGITSYPADRKVDIILATKHRTEPNSTIDISKIEKNATFRLDNIRFEPATATFKPGASEVLKKLLHLLETNPRLKIGIEGHVCGAVAKSKEVIHNNWEYTLSINRAKAVFDHLVKNGIDTSRLTYKGFGATKMLPEENTTEQACRNMRVEIRVLDK